MVKSQLELFENVLLNPNLVSYIILDISVGKPLVRRLPGDSRNECAILQFSSKEAAKDFIEVQSCYMIPENCEGFSEYQKELIETLRPIRDSFPLDWVIDTFISGSFRQTGTETAFQLSAEELLNLRQVCADIFLFSLEEDFAKKYAKEFSQYTYNGRLDAYEIPKSNLEIIEYKVHPDVSRISNGFLLGLLKLVPDHLSADEALKLAKIGMA